MIYGLLKLQQCVELLEYAITVNEIVRVMDIKPQIPAIDNLLNSLKRTVTDFKVLSLKPPIKEMIKFLHKLYLQGFDFDYPSTD